MKLLPLLSFLALSSTFSLATAIPRNADSTVLDLDKRTPEPALAAVEEQSLEERGRHEGGGGDDVDVDVNVKVKVKSGRPSYDWKPDSVSLPILTPMRARSDSFLPFFLSLLFSNFPPSQTLGTATASIIAVTVVRPGVRATGSTLVGRSAGDLTGESFPLLPFPLLH
jgi:hypothetical protein